MPDHGGTRGEYPSRARVVWDAHGRWVERARRGCRHDKPAVEQGADLAILRERARKVGIKGPNLGKTPRPAAEVSP
jgi:hypothetical protein